jgi:flagellar basal body-associated protein FliL
MANRSRQRAQRRNQIIMGIFAILLILSMVVSLVWSFSPPAPPATTTSQPQPTVIAVTPAP